MMVPLTLAARRDALGPHLHLAGAFRHLLQFLFVLPCQLLDSFVIVVAPVGGKLLDACFPRFWDASKPDLFRRCYLEVSSALAVMQARPVSNNHESSKRGVEAIPSQGGPPPSASPAIARRDRATDGK